MNRLKLPELHRPRILIVRLGAIGDIVFATSLLRALRRAWPDASIAWLVRAPLAPLLEGDPDLNQVIPWNYRGGGPVPLLRALSQLRRAVRAQPFDLVLDAQGLLKSRLLAWIAGGRMRVGFSSKEPGDVLLQQIVPRGGEKAAIGSEYRYLAELLTGQSAPWPRLRPAPEVRQRVQAALTQRGLKPGYTVFCPFTTRPQKHWMEDCWPDLARRLAEAGAGPVVMLGGTADREAAERITKAAPGLIINLAGATKLNEAPAWIEQAGLVIGVDTGLTHMGVALARPTLALFGSTRPYLHGGDGPLKVLYEGVPCSPCRRHPTCGGLYTCMRRLEPAQVAAEALALLRAPPSAAQ